MSTKHPLVDPPVADYTVTARSVGEAVNQYGSSSSFQYTSNPQPLMGTPLLQPDQVASAIAAQTQAIYTQTQQITKAMEDLGNRIAHALLVAFPPPEVMDRVNDRSGSCDA